MAALAERSAAVASDALPLAALQSRGTREQMSPGAVRLFLALADRWQLGVKDRLILLGDISRQTYYNWANGKVACLSRDQLERISLLLGIHKGLRLLFADEASAERWFKGANSDLPFAGRSPLERLLQGGMEDLYVVRRYIDSWRGGR
ncbi:MAG: MbcA/ParS/Xre antitoxin family protein [Hyphomicrobiales bacterium]|nr:MbcA/ParS/Xre antitoxin family protein [Hyphomicrobiales bacterium]